MKSSQYLLDSAFVPRVFLDSLITTAIFFPSIYDKSLTSLYIYLFRSAFYRFSAFETLETVFFYILIEVLYTIKFVKTPSYRIDVRGPKSSRAEKFEPKNSKRPRMQRSSRRMMEILTYIVPLMTLDFILVKKFADVPVSDIRASAGYSVTAGDGINPSFLLSTIHNFSFFSPLQLQRALPSVAPSSRRIVLKLIASFFIYDTLFFFIHIAFHKIPVLAAIHKPHHRHGEMNPQITNQLSVAERVALILLANFFLNIIKSHVLTRTMFVPIFVYLLIEVHSRMDLS